eukprot:CAMPEP_0170254856 /NCGR_PEP_ID=MMETSP0116_2-20130129/27280_1 /TAXON_ID=400756 /ORGANISM="Durinskia baltica, Strain CSIRO CS-38" /LENGTH=177 /DNA_ID=CAMNT_0010505863 /DNA_START=395 /DNA_END=928 /DNA_ORIENTATION=+
MLQSWTAERGKLSRAPVARAGNPRAQILEPFDAAIVAALDALLNAPLLVPRVRLLHEALATIGKHQQRWDEERLGHDVVAPPECQLDPALQHMLHEVLQVGNAPEDQHGPTAEDPSGYGVRAYGGAHQDQHHDGQHAAVMEEVIVRLHPIGGEEHERRIEHIPQATTVAENERRTPL